jgi:hypothetical protein
MSAFGRSLPITNSCCVRAGIKSFIGKSFRELSFTGIFAQEFSTAFSAAMCGVMPTSVIITLFLDKGMSNPSVKLLLWVMTSISILIVTNGYLSSEMKYTTGT